MKNMTEDEMVRLVMTFVDEVQPTGGLAMKAGDFATDLPLDSAIRSFLPIATRECIAQSKGPHLPTKAIDWTSAQPTHAPDAWLVPHPADYQRLAFMHLPAWQHEVRKTVDEESDEAQRQENPFLRAYSHRPIAIETTMGIVIIPASREELEHAQGAYVAFVPPAQLCEQLQTQVCRRCADMVLQAMNA